MKTILAIPVGLFFFFLPALVAYYALFATDPLRSESLVVLVCIALFFMGRGILREAEVSFANKIVAECIIVFAYLPYIYLISYGFGNSSLNILIFLMYTLFTAVLSVKLFSLISPDVFEYAARDKKNSFIKVSISAVGLHLFWIFFWFRVLNVFYIPVELSIFIGIILILVSILSWSFIKDFPQALSQISSTIYFSFYAISAIGLTVFIIKWIEEPSFLFPNAVEMTIGQQLINFLFAAFWIVYTVYSYKRSNALEKKCTTQIAE